MKPTDIAEILNEADIDMMELNISCPNIKEGGAAFGTNAKVAEEVVKAVRKVVTKPIIVKLSPNVTDICEIARAAEAGGADALSLINTLLGMRIDVYRRKPVLANKMGGFSGPAIHPVAVRMVYQASRAVKIPIIGMGGISGADDAVEFLLTGASAVAVGTANFVNPYVTSEIVDGIRGYMVRYGVENVKELIGAAE